MADGGKGERGAKLEKKKGRKGGRAVISEPASHAHLCKLHLRSSSFTFLATFRACFPPFHSSLHFPTLSLCPLSVLQCITNSDRENGFNSSLQLPDATLNFAKKHPLMEDKALARPLLLTKGVNFTRLAVDRVSALDQRAYNMIFIGTGTSYMILLKTFP